MQRIFSIFFLLIVKFSFGQTMASNDEVIKQINISTTNYKTHGYQNKDRFY